MGYMVFMFSFLLSLQIVLYYKVLRWQEFCMIKHPQKILKGKKKEEKRTKKK
ncbi:hypothetical protein BDV41DRAFT_555096 [Aspergillus transmontanensis]|uniref:Uncharacterized protein n=1 Tax=Aspergillus transmontanensis TaxID=1034304 RepID=A0A5N6VGP1_9EURO|nr:hypothetical protein BDV41DRAFT_555096 [Aspergillus transmontanensis]